MKKILIFGNSGSGKTTLAQSLVSKHGVAHLDLDTIAWQDTTPPQRRSLIDSRAQIDSFCKTHNSWVIEGCYADLLSLILDRALEVIFMNLSVEHCIENAKRRPWEPHKYASKEAQDENLNMLIDWIGGYETRSDSFSKGSHQALYDQFDGTKTLIKHNQHPS